MMNDPTIACMCGHPRLAHDNGNAVCCATQCPCMGFRAAASPEPRRCPKGHETGVKEIGIGRYFCLRCARTWTA